MPDEKRENRKLSIVQVSDTHLSRLRAYFNDNWQVFLAEMAADPPDLIVHTGDLALRGNLDEDDLIFGREQLARLKVPVRVIPGNHDIGDTPPDLRRGDPVNADTREAWVRHFGPDWWEDALGGWRLIGLNAQIFDSGLAAEAEQWEWLEDALANPSGRPILVFTHKGLYPIDPTSPARGGSHLNPESGQRLLALFGQAKVRMIACGHCHYYYQTRNTGIDMIWAPGTSFVTQRKRDAVPEAIHRVGYIRYTLEDERISHALVEPTLFVGYDMTNWSRAHGTTVKLPLKSAGPELQFPTASAPSL